ncbi:MAG TPA: adenosylcobinamide-GDP ribazoletransferase [Solirubrobacteraceae bacterium]|nr:adenosylcobinamide-GDP ribazoletransferase [Solirubrobacteraceae bacterium]
MHAHADGEAPAQGAVVARPPRAAPWSGLPGAIAFLTIVPIPGAAATTELAAAAGWFPLVGAAVGAFAGGVRVGAQQLLGRTPATVLAMIALVVVTGALHQDGLADTADGLGARGGRGRRLQAMRDSATGVFGALALIGWALLLLSTLASLDASRALLALIVACALGRWAALAHAIATPAARAEGLGAALRVGRLAFAAGSGVSIALALALCGLAPGAAAIGAALLLAALSALFARQTLGGRTGDTLGATVALTEVLVCTTLLALWVG